jgi:hypothetical protein
MKKLLPINDRPMIIGYTHHAYPLSIASINDNYKDWFFSNFIQLKSYKTFFPEDTFIDFDFTYHYYDNNPWIDTTCINEEEQEDISIEDLVIECIENDEYICIFVNQYFISGLNGYQSFHFTHEILIFGYDEKEQLFSAIGFDKTGNYSKMNVNKSELLLGYQHRNEKRLFNREYPIYKYKYSDRFKCKLDIDNIKDLINDYLLSTDTPTKRSQKDRLHYFEHVYGLSVYNYLKLYYSDPTRNKDIRPAHIFWEHKKVMLERLNYLYKRKIVNEKLYSKYENVVELASILRSKIMKYNFTSNSKELITIPELIDNIFFEEERILKLLLLEL